MFIILSFYRSESKTDFKLINFSKLTSDILIKTWVSSFICPGILLMLGSGCVAQLVEQSLPIPEVRSLNIVIGKNLFILNIWLLSTMYWKDENKEKNILVMLSWSQTYLKFVNWSFSGFLKKIFLHNCTEYRPQLSFFRLDSSLI